VAASKLAGTTVPILFFFQASFSFLSDCSFFYNLVSLRIEAVLLCVCVCVFFCEGFSFDLKDLISLSLSLFSRVVSICLLVWCTECGCLFWRLEVLDSPYSVGFISTLRELLLIRDQRLGFVVVPASCWFPEGSDPDGGVLLILNLERFGYFCWRRNLEKFLSWDSILLSLDARIIFFFPTRDSRILKLCTLARPITSRVSGCLAIFFRASTRRR
jgi:hypothetical protein